MRKAVSLLFVFALGCSSGGGAAPLSADRVVATPIPTPQATVEVTIPEATATPESTTPVARGGGQGSAQQALPAPVPAPLVPSTGIAAFTGLGAWIDVFDHNDDPATILPMVRDMAAQGTRTLYLETSRFASEADIQYPTAVGAALDEAKALGMFVVAWYPPTFDDFERDLRRSLVAIQFRSPKGNRFDAFGSDIEYTAGVPDHAERSRLAVEYSKQLREKSPPGYPLAAIVIPPTSFEINPGRWRDFPWGELAPWYDVFMPMNYWTARQKDPQTAAELTRRNTEETRRLTGRPVHTIGGLAADADVPQVAAYVDAAFASGSLGGSIYDYATTRPEVWGELRRLNW